MDIYDNGTIIDRALKHLKPIVKRIRKRQDGQIAPTHLYNGGRIIASLFGEIYSILSNKGVIFQIPYFPSTNDIQKAKELFTSFILSATEEDIRLKLEDLAAAMMEYFFNWYDYLPEVITKRDEDKDAKRKIKFLSIDNFCQHLPQIWERLLQKRRGQNEASTKRK